MSETLLFFHLLAAFILVAAIVMQSAFFLGAPVERRVLAAADALEAVGGIGVIVLGILLVVDIDFYEIFDGWILAAIVLWALAAESGRRAQAALGAGVEAAQASPATATTAAAVPVERRAVLTHAVKVALTVALLAVMVWKPGA